MANFAKSAYDIVNTSFKDQAKLVTYLQTSDTDFDADTGAVNVTTSNFKVRAIFLDYTATQLETDGVVSGDRKCLLPVRGTKFKPKVHDRIMIGTELWSVVSWELDPTGSALYTIQMRRVS